MSTSTDAGQPSLTHINKLMDFNVRNSIEMSPDTGDWPLGIADLQRSTVNNTVQSFLNKQSLVT